MCEEVLVHSCMRQCDGPGVFATWVTCTENNHWVFLDREKTSDASIIWPSVFKLCHRENGSCCPVQALAAMKNPTIPETTQNSKQSS